MLFFEVAFPEIVRTRKAYADELLLSPAANATGELDCLLHHSFWIEPSIFLTRVGNCSSGFLGRLGNCCSLSAKLPVALGSRSLLDWTRVSIGLILASKFDMSSSFMLLKPGGNDWNWLNIAWILPNKFKTL